MGWHGSEHAGERHYLVRVHTRLPYGKYEAALPGEPNLADE